MNDEAKQRNTFREFVKKLNHMISDMTGGCTQYLFALKAGCNVAVLIIGERSLTITPSTGMNIYLKLQRMERQFGGDPVMPHIILDLLLNKNS